MIRFALTILFLSCTVAARSQQIILLGTAQDAGYPHIGCEKQCCNSVKADPSLSTFVVSFALLDTAEKKWWLFEATPDMPAQLDLFRRLTDSAYSYLPAGFFVTHAHIGHYTGLMYLGREALGAKAVPVYALPRFCEYLRINGPWSQLVSLRNMSLQQMQADSAVVLSSSISVTAFTVPHRDEFSETAGFRIHAGEKTVLFIPDIDKWSRWDRDIVQQVRQADLALLDATFYSADELPGRNMQEIPHPLVTETMFVFEGESATTRNKVVFIHFNHSNPLLWDAAMQGKVKAAGFRVGSIGMRF